MIGNPATGVQHRNLAIALMLLLTLAGLALRFYRLSNQSMWTDEVSSVEIARKPLSQITQESGSENVYLPGYFLLLGTVLSDDHRDVEFRARGLSALAGGLSVPLLIGLVFCWRRQWGTALLAGLLLAVNPLHLWYSQVEWLSYYLPQFYLTRKSLPCPSCLHQASELPAFLLPNY